LINGKMARTVPLPRIDSRTSSVARIRRLVLSDRAAVVGVLLLLAVVIGAVGAPVLTRHDPNTPVLTQRGQPPSRQHWLGTDELGRDVYSRILYGGRISLTVSTASVAGALVVGVPLGLVAGYARGSLDLLVMRVTDVMLAVPSMLLALAVVAVLGTATQNVVAAIGIVYIPGFARLMRASILTIAGQEYVAAAKAIGARSGRIMRCHLLPNAVSPLLVQATVYLAYAMLTEASLSFFGLGVQPPAPTWGNLLSEGKPYMESMPWLTLVPGIAIMVGVLGFNLVGDALRDLTDPRLRNAR
jgi:peptide/nickel transport system permease protein